MAKMPMLPMKPAAGGGGKKSKPFGKKTAKKAC